MCRSSDAIVGSAAGHDASGGGNRYFGDCTPGYYNFEGAENRRQDGNFNGSMQQYLDFMAGVRAEIGANFELVRR